MKRKLLISIIPVILLIAGCGSDKQTEAEEFKDAVASVVESESETEIGAAQEETGGDRPFTAEEDKKASVIDYEALGAETGERFKEIGYNSDQAEIQCVNFTESGDTFSYDALFSSNDAPTLCVQIVYIGMTDTAMVSKISNHENGHVYWTIENMREYTDIYDYKTDELISPKEKDFDMDEYMQGEEEKFDQIAEDYQQRFQETLEKYGVAE